MRPIEYIRKNVFVVPQAVFADFAGVTQATVSRWEAGEFGPRAEELERIRAVARTRGIPWDDRWFFEVPDAAAEASS